jgi:predicted ATPase/DNA-binding winged helix-turn-helix (wHTH) protein
VRLDGVVVESIDRPALGGHHTRSSRTRLVPRSTSILTRVPVTQRVDTRNAPGAKPERVQLDTPAPPSAVTSPSTQNKEGAFALGASASRERIASFGPFRLYTSQRVLEKNSKPLKIGSRALDVLLTLLEHAPEVVSNRDLIQRAWGKLVVDEVSLRVHVAALRKRFGDEQPLGGYIKNVPGRGYCFAGEVTWTAPGATPRNTLRAAPQLPREPLLIVGRDNVVRELSAQLEKQRFVSIVGAGGIGKTTIALALAHRMLSEFQGVVHFLDLAGLEDPKLLARMLASQLGLVAVSEHPLPVILTFLREQRMLLVFDSCEHIIEAVATLTENIFRDAPEVHILATSREALRAEGEQVHHLPPLACPPANAESLTAAEALGYSAVQLFIKQVANRGHALELTDAEAPIVAEICRRLDGIALALELAASRVGAHGVQGTASLLDKHFRLLWHGRRTALPRHQTLSATLDWSYNLLSGIEQLILRRLAVFVGGFSLEAALDVAAEGLDPAELAETLAALVEKSLLILDSATALRYRLLDTTRTYAWRKLTESGEAPKIARRHCEYLLHALEQFGVTVWAPHSRETVGFFVSNLTNLRAALDWCFSDEGDTGLGAKLTGASAGLFIQVGLLTECVTWTDRAIHALGGHGQGTRLELELQACFAPSIMVTTGNVPAARTALVRALDIAERLEEAPMQLYLLHALYMWQIRSGDLRGFRELTGRIETVAEQIADPFAEAIAHGFRAVTCFFTGDNREVARHAKIAMDSPVQSAKLNVVSFGHLHRAARPILARNLWVLGYPDQARAMAAEAVREADALNHPFAICYVIMSCVVVALDNGDWQRAAELTHRMSSVAAKHNLLTYARAAVGWQGRLAISRGDLARGIELLQAALAALHEDGYELYRPQFSVSLAEGFAKTGQLELASSTICEAVTWAEGRGRILNFIDSLRVKGEILNLKMPADTSEGETCLVKSLHLAHERGLLSLELRSGVGLARLWAGRGATNQALELLGSIFSRFSEGFKTRELLAAAALLDELRTRI